MLDKGTSILSKLSTVLSYDVVDRFIDHHYINQYKAEFTQDTGTLKS